jgi:hypothetical protein
MICGARLERRGVRLRLLAALLCSTAVPLIPCVAAASVDASVRLHAVKAAVPPPLAASDAAPVWRTAVVARDFMNFTDRSRARLRVTARLLYDAENIYVEFHSDQAGVPITATQRVEHAGVGSDDHVGFELDTSGNGSRVYTFRVNPLGVHDESSSENSRYAPPWTSIAASHPDGSWDAMLVIPLSDIRAQSGSVQDWRINFERYVAARNADQTWAYASQMQSIGEVQYWPWLTGVRIAAGATRPKPRADAYVLDSAGSQRDEFQNGIGHFQKMQPRIAGIDVTYPFTNTLALVGTLNPDFSNVEEDQTTIELQEFQRQYQEYRPFFAQGAQYINALPSVGVYGGNELFYSPAIGVFDRGLKVEGTAGRSAIGALNVVGPGVNDNAAGYDYAAPDGSVNLSMESVLANHPGIRDETTGFGFTRLNSHSGERTQIEYAAETDTANGDGHDFNLSEGLQNQHFAATAYYRDTSPQYSPLDGYVATSDSRGLAASLGYRGTGAAAGPLTSYHVNLTADRFLAYDGSVRQADINAFWNIEFKNLVTVQGFAGPSELQVAPGVIEPFNRRQIELDYKASTPSPAMLSYSWGPFGSGFVQQFVAAYTRTTGPYVVSFEYDGNIERAHAGGAIRDSQWLRRITLARALGNDASFGVALRAINGTGGFAQPGVDLSALYQQRFANQDLLYVEFGTPAAPQTLHRIIVKYVFHAGGASGA